MNEIREHRVDEMCFLDEQIDLLQKACLEADHRFQVMYAESNPEERREYEKRMIDKVKARK